jgi:RNA polymerase sigma-70 factor, ECF subfamily
LIFTCCHPALAQESQVALTLRLLGGLTVPEIAAAFLVEERALAQRITRAKQKIAAANIPYRIPDDHELPERLEVVLTVLWLVFNEGYLPRESDAERADLVDEAVRLTRVLAQLMPDEPEVWGLLATMLLTRARARARLVDGVLVPLPAQDRTRWDHTLIDEGHALVRRCLQANRPGPHQILAAINAVHTDAPTPDETDWSQIVALYDQWLLLAPTPVVELNRAVAVAELSGPEAGLDLVDRLDLDDYHAWHVTRAELLRRLGRETEAQQAFRRAIDLATNPAERAHLESRVSD